jgi:hypothetical protein
MHIWEGGFISQASLTDLARAGTDFGRSPSSDTDAVVVTWGMATIKEKTVHLES